MGWVTNQINSCNRVFNIVFAMWIQPCHATVTQREVNVHCLTAEWILVPIKHSMGPLVMRSATAGMQSRSTQRPHEFDGIIAHMKGNSNSLVMFEFSVIIPLWGVRLTVLPGGGTGSNCSNYYKQPPHMHMHICILMYLHLCFICTKTFPLQKLNGTRIISVFFF